MRVLKIISGIGGGHPPLDGGVKGKESEKDLCLCLCDLLQIERALSNALYQR